MPESNLEASRRGGHDPLLTTVRWLLTALLVGCLILGVFCLLAYPIILLNKGYFLAGFATTGIPPSAIPWIGVLGVVAAAELALTYLFLRNLRRMIESVAHGQPFERINADRLRRMAWLSVAMQIVAVPMTRLIVWFDALPHKPNVHHNDDGISIGAILLTLVIFVLARVFRTGAEMQEDLEGTV
jgi:hypothetical protein